MSPKLQIAKLYLKPTRNTSESTVGDWGAERIVWALHLGHSTPWWPLANYTIRLGTRPLALGLGEPWKQYRVSGSREWEASLGVGAGSMLWEAARGLDPCRVEGPRGGDPEMSWEGGSPEACLVMDSPASGSFPVGKGGHHRRTTLEMTVWGTAQGRTPATTLPKMT